MLAFTLRRAIQAIGVMIAVGIISFSMFRFAGDPVNQMVAIDTSFAERSAIRKSLGLDDPIPIQFARYFANAAQFDFGVSYQFRQPVAALLKERMPATLELATCAALLAVVFVGLMGVYSALRRDSSLAKVFQAISLIGISLPTFLIGILLIYLFSVVLGWLPSFGRGEVVRIGWWTTGLLTVSGLKALIMPSITLGLFQMTLIMRLVRAEMLEVLRTDYIRFARARGLTTRAVHFGHALKNTLVPVITVAGLQFGSVIAFAIITETVFQWPGMGLMFVQAVQNVDIPIMAAYLLMVSLIFVTINLVVDILYALRISLVAGVLGVVLAGTLGITLGLIAGYVGGATDGLIMRIADVQLTFPAILIALLINGVAKSVFGNRLDAMSTLAVLVFAIGLSFWVQYARTVRGSVMVEKSKDYVAAAQLIGLPASKIMLRHVLPNAMGPILVIATINLALAIITEATLSFLGSGMPDTMPSLGTLIRIGNNYLFAGEWWIVAFPGIALAGLILSINLLGDWLRDALNPKLR